MEKRQNMDNKLTIQQMAQATGLSAHTLRYYERVGLISQHVERADANGYRSYSWEHMRWFEFIKRLRATGMPIRDIQCYTDLMRQGEQTIPERLQLLKQHQSRVEENLKEVAQHLEAITSKIAYYEHQSPSC
jgi:DNA-binding transcriptional MerR regulator